MRRDATIAMRDVPGTWRPRSSAPLKVGTGGRQRTGAAVGNRRAMIPINAMPAIAQRFAIDYVLINSEGRTFTGDRLKNESYGAEGVEAIAVADGIVVATKDSIPENIPGPASRAVPITLETVGGNHVILEWAMAAMRSSASPASSLGVKIGDRVKRATIGLVGNTVLNDHTGIFISPRQFAVGAKHLTPEHWTWWGVARA